MPGSVTLAAAMTDARGRIDAVLAQALAGIDLPVAQAMAYAVHGGKTLRGFLAMETARIHGIDPIQAEPAAAAIEAMHAYSLVHDDLPCMDNDDFRRGQPTVHRKWDDATAVLAGDALQALAFDLLTQTGGADRARLTLVATLARAAGVRGMVGGQAMDMAAETATTPLTLPQIERLQAGKTGALITWSALVGPRLAQADEAALTIYGDALGLAFQIADDVLDVTGDSATVGKAVGKDAVAGKATFVSLLGLDEAKRRASSLVTKACDALSVYGQRADLLRDLAQFVIARDK